MKYLYLTFLLCIHGTAFAESKHIEVYATSQVYWDVQQGDTLSSIVYQLVPGTSAREKLMTDILSLNPDAFINGNPDRLKAHVRLWLPNGTQDMQKLSSNSKFRIKNFSWGQVIQRK